MLTFARYEKVGLIYDREGATAGANGARAALKILSGA
jgi:hypothetical protein